MDIERQNNTPKVDWCLDLDNWLSSVHMVHNQHSSSQMMNNAS